MRDGVAVIQTDLGSLTDSIPYALYEFEVHRFNLTSLSKVKEVCGWGKLGDIYRAFSQTLHASLDNGYFK